jgi:glycosyltransferase involved in cell wall biosynthesis
MRILHALAQRPGKTGSGFFLQELFVAGDKKGYEQAVLAGVTLSEKEMNVENLKEENFFPIYFQSEELPFPVVGMSDVMPYDSTKYSDITEEMYVSYKKAFASKIKEAVETFKPDVVISNHLWLMSSFIKELYPDLRVLCLCHGTDLRQSELSPNLFNIVKKNITKCDYAFALNDVQRETIISKYGFKKSQVIVSGTGYDPSTFFQTQKPKASQVKILYVGKISKAKGVQHLLKAFEALEYEKEDISLTLIGGGVGEESDELQKIIKNMNSNVNALGFVEQTELLQNFYDSHIFILPSFFEGLPLVIIQALACGARVISTKLPGLSEFLGKEFEELNAISYVALPHMHTIDTPKDYAVKGFEEDIKLALEMQIDAVLRNEKLDLQAIDERLVNKTWDGLFKRLEFYMKE